MKQRLFGLLAKISSAVFLLKVLALATGNSGPICENAHLTASEGTITSPNYPTNYSFNFSCTWIINVTVDYCSSIELFINDFDLQDQNQPGNCPYNFKIYDNNGKNQLAWFDCGQESVEIHRLKTNFSTTHNVTIALTSNDTIKGRGFNITYNTVHPQEKYIMFVDKGNISVVELHCHCDWILYNNTDQHLAAVQFDPSKKIFYIFDSVGKVISRYELIGWKRGLRFKDHIVTDNIEDVTSIAVDSVNERLYWSDASFNAISTSRLDGSQRRALITSNLRAPSYLLLGPECRYIYWTCIGTNYSTIERAFVDGSSHEEAESERDEGPFVLTMAGPTLHRIKTNAGLLYLYNLSQPFLTRGFQKKSNSFRNASSAVKVDNDLWWSANSETFLGSIDEGKHNVFKVLAPPSRQLLYYTTENELSASTCASTNQYTKVSSSTEKSEVQTSLPTSISQYPSNTVVKKFTTLKDSNIVVSTLTKNRDRIVSSSTVKSKLQTSLPTNITVDPKSTAITSFLVLKDPKRASFNPTSAEDTRQQYWYILLVAALVTMFCIGLVFARIRYKRSIGRSFILSHSVSDKSTFKLLDKELQSFSTPV